MKQRKHIQFDEKFHTYTNTLTKEVYTSVTTFLKQFHERFDADAIASNLITNHPKYQEKYYGVDFEEAVAMLKTEWKISADVGNRVHSCLENYLLGNSVFDKTKSTDYNNRIRQLTQAWDKLNLKEIYHDYEFHPELLLFNDELKLAGQADLILVNAQKETFIVLDYKTNKKGITTRSYGNKKMFAPVNHLDDCNYCHYALQLNIYAHLLTQETGFTCEKLALLWVDTNHSNRISIDTIPVPFMEKEINSIFSHSLQKVA